MLKWAPISRGITQWIFPVSRGEAFLSLFFKFYFIFQAKTLLLEYFINFETTTVCCSSWCGEWNRHGQWHHAETDYLQITEKFLKISFMNDLRICVYFLLTWTLLSSIHKGNKFCWVIPPCIQWKCFIGCLDFGHLCFNS